MSSPSKKPRSSQWVIGAWQRLLNLGFRLLYNELAWSYDWVSWAVSRGQWRSWQMAAVPYLTGERILELAHGPGHMLLALEAAGYRVTGLDLSPMMGKLASRRIGDSGAAVALVRGQAQYLPFAEATYDSVLATFPTEFLAEMETIAEVYRLLRPGGSLIVVPQARLTGRSALTRFIEWLYAITGQRPDTLANERAGFWQVISDRFMLAGFELEMETVGLELSEVTVVIAQKPMIDVAAGSESA